MSLEVPVIISLGFFPSSFQQTQMPETQIGRSDPYVWTDTDLINNKVWKSWYFLSSVGFSVGS